MRRPFLHCAILLILLIMLAVPFLMHGNITGFAVLQLNESQGSYEGTYYNSTLGAIVVNGSSGTYISPIFDAGLQANWTNISWSGNANEVCKEIPDNQPVEAGNILLLHFNKNLLDTSGNSHNLTCIDCPTYSEKGVLNSSLDFNEKEYIQFIKSERHGSIYSNNQLTVEAWVNPRQLGNGWGPVIIYDASNNDLTSANNGYVLFFNAGNGGVTPAIQFGIGGGAVVGTVSIDIGKWQHFAATFNGSYLALYKNGVQIANKSYTIILRKPSTRDTVSIGRTYADYQNSFDGLLDELALYNRALSAEEILEHYKQGVLQLNISIRSCDDANCEGDIWGQSIPLNSQYFQYKVDLEGCAELYTITLEYEVDTPEESVTAPTRSSTSSHNHPQEKVIVNDAVTFSEESIAKVRESIPEVEVIIERLQPIQTWVVLGTFILVPGMVTFAYVVGQRRNKKRT